MNFRDLKMNFWVNIVASIAFVFILQPIADKTWVFVNSSSSQFIVKITSSIYQNAALGTRNWLDFMLFTALLLVIVGYLYFSTNKFNPFNKFIDQFIGDRAAKMSEKSKKGYLLFLDTILTIAFIGLLFTTSKIWFDAYADLQMNTSFNQKLTAIAPFIDELEEEKLKSRWSLMSNRDDYLNINETIDSLAILNKIVLPKNLY